MNAKQQEENKRRFNEAKQLHMSLRSELKNLTTEEPSSGPVQGIVEGDKVDVDVVEQHYIKSFRNETWYEPPSRDKDGYLTVSFPDKKTAYEFAEDLAKENLEFIFIDQKTGKVVAYSNGNGELNRNEDSKTLDEVKAELQSTSYRP